MPDDYYWSRRNKLEDLTKPLPGWLNADWQEVQVRKEDSVELWGFTGGDQLYPTKMLAERAARIAFPDEDPYKRYARIFYRRYHWDGI